MNMQDQGFTLQDIKAIVGSEIAGNLHIEIDTERSDYYSKGVTVKVRLLYNSVCISEASTYESFLPA